MRFDTRAMTGKREFRRTIGRTAIDPVNRNSIGTRSNSKADRVATLGGLNGRI